MVTLDDLMAFLDEFMGDVGDKDPYMPNGLQVRGREEIKLLATGVSASQRLFKEAVARKADAIDLVPFWIYRAADSAREPPTFERKDTCVPFEPEDRTCATAEEVTCSLPIRDRPAKTTGAPGASPDAPQPRHNPGVRGERRH